MTTSRYRATTPTVAVVGGGFAGIAAGVKLLRAGIPTFAIYEKAPTIGGTWRENTYPGCEVDTPSILYSFSFTRPDWTRTHVGQEELRAHLEEVVDQFGLRPHLRLGVGVDRAVWDERSQGYRLELDDGTSATCDVVISAVGFLNVPNEPDWPGLDTFAGPVFHTAQWEHHHDLDGKRIAVIGTGSSAAQLVPHLAERAEQVLLFQREPGWILPKGERELTPDERARRQRPLARRLDRLKQLRVVEKNLWRGGSYTPGSAVHTRAEAACRAYIEHEFADHPDLREAVTPTYPYWGKRVIFASTFYPTLRRDDVELVPRAVVRVTETGVVDADGIEHPVDVIVLATGFQPTNYLAHLRVVGRGGRSLHDHWDGEPNAFLGITVPGFPNFFMLYGPGTNGGEIVWMLERQSEYAVRAIRRLMRTGATAVEVRPLWGLLYDRWLQRSVRNTAWAVSHNYFTSDSGRIVTQWPYSPMVYAALTKTLGRWSERLGRR